MSNSNSAQLHGIDFQPMPKRFIVRDEIHKHWLRPYDSEESESPYVFEMYELLGRLSLVKLGIKEGFFKIIQSTNLFDKDGKEIFEGSIISSHSGDLIGVVKQHKSGEWRIWWDNIENGSTTLSEPNVYPLTLIGHILSNPELLKGESC